MRYTEKYPEPPREYLSPPDREVESGVLWTARAYLCDNCKVHTQYRLDSDEHPGVPCCSEECRAALLGSAPTLEQVLTHAPAESVDLSASSEDDTPLGNE